MSRFLFARAGLCAVVTVLFLSVSASPVSAGVNTVRFDITDAPLGFFGIVFNVDYATTVGEVQNQQIVDTRFHLEFNTENAVGGSLADAANIAIDFQPPTINLPIFSLSGADLGWSGTGAFTGDLQTSALNEPFLDFGPVDPDTTLALWFFRIINLDDANPLLGGQFSNSYIEVDIVPVPEPATFAMLAVGGLTLVRRRAKR